MQEQDLLASQDGPVLTLTLNRPALRNSMSPAIIGGLTERLAKVPDGVRVIVLTGAGDKAFCAGADLQTGKAFKFDHSQPRAAFADLLRVGRQCAVPVVGRINGTCVAGGMGILGLCDIAIAADHGKFGLPEVKVGVFPMQVLAVLQHLVPRRKLIELCLTGELISAQEALALGFVNHVVPAGELDAAVAKMVEKLLAAAPSAIRRGKYAMTAIETMDFEQAIAFLEGQIGAVALTEDAQEGMAAFREKRKPNWPGR
jgi:enoyl-CoA hydratase/carnithine racemase